MAFMETQYYIGPYVGCDETGGPVGLGVTYYMPEADWESDFGPVIERGQGVLSRLSAPGYLDCTDWMPYGSLEEAREAFREDGIDPDTGDPVE